jgi:uncharacterized protein
LMFWLLTGARYHDISPRDEVEKFDTPLLLIHGEKDTYIQPEMSIELYQRKIRGLRKLWIAPDAEHAEAYDKNPEEYSRQIEIFLQDIHLI